MNDLLQESLNSICAISLHWSSDCNMACKYCYIDKDKPAMAGYNRKIIEALEDGSYVENMKKIFNTEESRNRIENLSLWGAEPTINGNYFEKTITALLDYFTNVNSFMFSTNALLGGDWLYTKFYLPLYNYAESHQRKINWELQFSLDGPPEFNDDSRHDGATETTLQAIDTIIKNIPQSSDYLRLRLITKPTLDISYMRIMNEQGIECFNWYYQFFNRVQKHAMDLAKDKPNIDIALAGPPTLVDPGFYTIDDGKVLAEWLHNLRYIDRTKIDCYDHLPLFSQFFSGFDAYYNRNSYYNPIAHEFQSFSCSASKNNITVDHEGKLYTCNRLCRNSALSEELRRKHAMRANSNLYSTDKQWLMKTWGSQAFHSDLKSRRQIFDGLVITMAIAGQIDKKYAHDADARTLMFYSSIGMACHIGYEEDLTTNPSLTPTGIIRLLGNGALDEFFQYLAIEEKRGNIKVWKTVQ